MRAVPPRLQQYLMQFTEIEILIEGVELRQIEPLRRDTIDRTVMQLPKSGRPLPLLSFRINTYRRTRPAQERVGQVEGFP